MVLPVELKNNPITIFPVSQREIKLWFRDLAPEAAKGWESYSFTFTWPLSVFFTIRFSQRTLSQLPGAHTPCPVEALRSLGKASTALGKMPCAQNVWWRASVWDHWESSVEVVAFWTSHSVFIYLNLAPQLLKGRKKKKKEGSLC